MDDELLCYRLQKRLRISGPDALSPLAGGPYSDVNGYLQALHSERLARRATVDSLMDYGGCEPAAGSTGLAQAHAMTNFSLADVVQCGHGLGGRCLQCSGRFVQNVPLAMYGAYCNAYGAAGGSASSSRPAPQPAMGAPRPCGDLSFAAFASLAACLSPEPGERLLCLGSGAGRAVVTWALLLPHSAASGVEGCPALHAAAVAAAARLEPEVQARLFLHHGDVFAAQEDWHQAGIILIDASGYGDGDIRRFAEGLDTVRPGTRVASLSRPLARDPNAAPSGFSLARSALYRTSTSGNSTVFIYRKLDPEVLGAI